MQNIPLENQNIGTYILSYKLPLHPYQKKKFDKGRQTTGFMNKKSCPYMTKLLLILLNSLLILKRVKEIVRILCNIVSALSVYVCGLKHSTAFMHRSYKA